MEHDDHIVKDEHVVVYDIFDRMASVIQDMNNISYYVKDGWKLPNSMQSVLGKIYRYEGQTVSDISRIYDIDLKNTTKYVRELEKRGLVYKEKEGKHKILKLTAEGRDLHKILSEEKAKLLDVILSTVGQEDIETTARTLLKMAEQTHKFYESVKEENLRPR